VYWRKKKAVLLKNVRKTSKKKKNIEKTKIIKKEETF